MPLKDLDLDAIIKTVGPVRRVQYNKPHVYPMAAPMFVTRPRAEHEHPPDGPVEVYVHVPFCRYKCSFCTYATRQHAQREQMDAYVQAVETELDWIEPGTALVELYVGGGTPTALPASLLSHLIAKVWTRVRSPAGAVHTVECSPETLTADHVRVFEDHQIGRVSMGIQSLDDRVLRRLTRDHSGREAIQACDRLVAGGRMVNVDLIYGLPAQTEDSFAEDFRTVAACGVHSVTVYNLRLNERTPVAGKLEPSEDLDLTRLVTWRAAIRAVADELGFTQTRWHTFTRTRPAADATHPARRFENMPAVGNQIGVGMSARSRLNAIVYRNHTDLGQYLQRIADEESPVQEVFELTEADRKALFVGQYLGNGRALDRTQYRDAFGCSFDRDFGPVLSQLRTTGLIEERDTAVALTEAGKLVFDLVNWMFYPQAAKDWMAGRDRRFGEA